MKNKANFKVTTKVIFKNNKNQFLLLKNKKPDSSGSCFDLPGGTVETGEQLSTTISREIFEELSINIDFDDLKLFNTYIVNRNKGDYDLALIVYITDVVISNIALSSEHEDYMFVDKQQIIELDDNKHIMSILKDVTKKFT